MTTEKITVDHRDRIMVVILADSDRPDEQLSILPTGAAMTIAEMREWLREARQDGDDRG